MMLIGLIDFYWCNMRKIDYWHFYKKHTWMLLLIGFISICYAFSSVIPFKLLMGIIDSTINKVDSGFGNLSELIMPCLLYVFLLLLSFVLLSINRYINEILWHKVGTEIRMESYKRIENMYQSFFDQNNTSTMLSVLISDSEIAATGVALPMSTLISAIFAFSLNLYFILDINIMLGLILIPVVILLGVITKITGNRYGSLVKENRKKYSKFWDYTQRNLTAMRDIHANNQEDKMRQEFNYASVELQNNMILTAKYVQKTSIINSLCIVVLDACLVIMGIVLIYNKQISIGALVGLITYSKSFLLPIQSFVSFIQEITKSKNSMKRINDTFFDVNPNYVVNLLECGNELEKKDALVFEKVNFSYDKKKVINDLSFSVKSGESLGIVGETGCGKSTILKLCEGLYPIDSGSIYIFGLNTKKDMSKIRDLVACAFQDTFLFNDSIANNIKLANYSCSIEDFEKVIECSCLKQLIKQLPEGINTNVGERGVQISGGEKQRIGVARALLRKPRILLLDEATSSLDNETEKKMMTNIRENFPGLTIISIAHRLASLKNCDRIVYIQSGKIVESGTEEELIKLRGKYYNLKNTSSEE